MKLGKLLDVEMLRAFMKDGFILRRNHPTLPLAILNYSNSCMFQDFWPEVVQQCRGLVIGAVRDHDVCDDCDVIARPFHKFFNLNHSSEPLYHEGNLPAVVPTVTEKMDGWFGILWKLNYAVGDKAVHYGVASRGSFESPGADFATAKLGKLIKYGAIDEFPAGYSAVFEIIFKAGRIVVDYPYEGLVLLALVNNETGEEMPYDELRNVWAKIAAYAADNRPWIRLVKAHNLGSDWYDRPPHRVAQAFEAEQGELKVKNMEGFVLTYPRPGTFPIKVKIKFEDYKRLHKLITGVTPQMIWGAVHDPMAPWMGSAVPAHFREWAIKWRDDLYNKFHADLINIHAIAREVLLNTEMSSDTEQHRKRLFEALNARDTKVASIAMTLLNGKVYEAHQAIWKRIRPVGREDVFYREGQGE